MNHLALFSPRLSALIRGPSWSHLPVFAAGCLTAAPLTVSAQANPIRGFPADALAERSRLETVLRETPDTALLRRYMRAMTEEPHDVGRPGSKKVADYALGLFQSWGLDARIDEYEALIPLPLERRLELLAPTHYPAALREPAIPEDPDSGDEGQIPTFNAYSADGDVTGELVYANFGLPADYAVLARLGVDVRGKIVIVRYGRSHRGIKPKVAAEHGAIGCIIYSDPREDGYYLGDVYPKGPMRPPMGVQRGNVKDLATYPGDPLTPGWGSRAGGRKLDFKDAASISKVPVLPISYADAQPLLEALAGPVAPNADWKGALPLTYHLGPGPARVRLAVRSEWKNRPVYNVMVRIPGSTYPDQWVIAGNHHDAWVNGAEDPVSAAVALMEAARSFATLLKSGWRPQRTVIFALWDGEERGLLGSTEWVEDHAEELRGKAVAYFNSDSYSAGWLDASGSHTLETFFREVARDTKDPKSGLSAIDARIARDLATATSAEDSARARRQGFRLGALGSGSDYTSFLDFLTIASIDLSHEGATPHGIYHSIYDSYAFYTRFLDPTFAYGKAQSGAMGVAVARMADAPVLPFSFVDAARTYEEYIDELETLTRRRPETRGMDLSALRAAVARLAEAGRAFETRLGAVLALGSPALKRSPEKLGMVNQDIYQSERDLKHSGGLPRRPWFQHTIYAPGYYTGYGVKTMPGVREALERGDREEAAAQAVFVTAAISRMADRAARAARSLAALSDRRPASKGESQR